MAVINGDGAGNVFSGTTFDDIMNGFGGDDSLNGLGGNDYMVGGTGRDVVSGGSGNDVLRVGAGEVVATEAYYGGTGVDTLLVSSIFPSSLVVNADFRATTISSFEKLTFEGGNRHNVLVNSSQVGTGLSSALAVNGGTGSNSIGITMNQASLNLSGWTFTNWGINDGLTVTGTAAAETVTGTSQGDYFKLGTGKDSIFAGGGEDKMEVGTVTAQSVYDGGTGFDTMFATADWVDLSNSTITSIEKITFRGSGEGQSHTVAVEADQFAVNGLSFKLQLDGMTGDVNTLTVFMGGQQSINLSQVTAIDAGADTRGQFIGDADAEQIGGTAMNDTISGNAGADDLSGYDGNDTLVGGTGDDIMRGGDGSDTYFLDSAGDQAIEKDFSLDDGGIDTVHATGFNYTLGEFFENLILHGGDLDGRGNALANTLTGTDGANLLRGFDGDDRIIGGKGADTMTGDNGADTFVFTSILDSGNVVGLRDRIGDFVSGADWIDVSAIDANTTLAGDQAFTLDTDGVLAQGEFGIKFLANGSAIVNFNVDIGSAPDMEILLTNVTSLQITDFIL